MGWRAAPPVWRAALRPRETHPQPLPV